VVDGESTETCERVEPTGSAEEGSGGSGSCPVTGALGVDLSPEGLDGVLSRVLSSFMSLMLWM